MTPESREKKLQEAMARLTRREKILPEDTQFTVETEKINPKESGLSEGKIHEIQSRYAMLEQTNPELLAKETGVNKGTVQKVLDKMLYHSEFKKVGALIRGVSTACLRVSALCFDELENRLSNPDKLRSINEVTLSGIGSYAISRSIDLANANKEALVEKDTYARIHEDGQGDPGKPKVETNNVFD